LSPAPTLSLYRGGAQASYVALPVIGAAPAGTGTSTGVPTYLIVILVGVVLAVVAFMTLGRKKA
jgi:hypothetical protein